MDAKQLRSEIVRPALKAVDRWSPTAEDLVMGTAAQESRLLYVRQLGGGPALSLFQIEPATYADYWQNYLDRRPELAAAIRHAVATNESVPAPERMIWDLRFASIMCRVHYLRIPTALPDYGDIHGYARYWKRYYNTEFGAGTVQEFVDNFRLVQ